MTATKAVRARIAPSGGYNFPAKEGYRDFVWRFIAGGATWIDPAWPVMLMPSLEGAEIEVAKRHGFTERNLHIVDANPAVIATLRRKDKYPGTTGYGVAIGRAHDRAAVNGVSLYGASIDFCSNVGVNVVCELDQCGMSGAWRHGARVVVNVLRGRESGLFTMPSALCAPPSGLIASLASDCALVPKASDVWRVVMISQCCSMSADKPGTPGSLERIMASNYADVVRWSMYRSTNGQTFMSVAMRVYHVRRLLADQKHKAYRARSIAIIDRWEALRTREVDAMIAHSYRTAAARLEARESKP